MSTKVWAAILVLLALAGCGEDSTVVVMNQPPTIDFTFTRIGVPAVFPVDLSVSVADADEDDNLTVTWSITRGTLTPKNPGKTIMEWAVPATLGADTVVVSVTDGEETATVTEVIEVGTLVRSTPRVTYLKSESPYILRADGVTPPRLVIGGGFTAAIEAGVEILVDLQETTIDVTGALNIQGTASEPVVIRANDRSLFCDAGNWWEGILVGTDVTSGSLDLDYAQIWYANNGVRLRDGGDAVIRNSKFTCCSNGVLHEGTGELTVTDTEISSSTSNGITASALTLLPRSITITGCNISINGNTGISLDLNDPFQEVPITIEDNKIEFNSVHGISMKNWVWPTIQYNHISANGSISNVWLQGPFHDAANPDTLDISCNYWGAVVSNQSTIESTVRDRLDSAGLGTRLMVSPWLNEDPYQAPSRPACVGAGL